MERQEEPDLCTWPFLFRSVLGPRMATQSHLAPCVSSSALLRRGRSSVPVYLFDAHTTLYGMLSVQIYDLKVNVDQNDRVNSRLTAGLTEARSATAFSSLRNVCRATHTSFLFSSHTLTLGFASLFSWESISLFLQHALVVVSQT